jgi:5-methylcytosine-specific restriction endonuclease McrA
MREIEELVAEIAPKPDVVAFVRAVPVGRRRGVMVPAAAMTSVGCEMTPGMTSVGSAAGRVESSGARSSGAKNVATPLSPRRYKLQVTIGQEARDKLAELQALLSHRIPDGDVAAVIEQALDALLVETKKRKAAVTERPRSEVRTRGKKTRAIPARVRREVFERDEGRCAFVDGEGRRCGSSWQVEFHHRVAFAKGGLHGVGNVELRCRGHNQYEAELEYGREFMAVKRGRVG